MIPKKILLLHGALGGRDQFSALSEKLSDGFSVFSLNLEGHGGVKQSDREFRIQYFAEGVIEWMDRYHHKKLDLFGYSMGGYVGLYLALHYPERIGSLFTLGTKFFWNAEIAAKEAGMLDPEKIEAKVPAFANQLKKRHTAPNDWKQVVSKTSELLQALGKKQEVNSLEVKRIENRVRIGVGDRDNLVDIQEARKLSDLLPNSELMVLPNTPHPIDKVNAARLSVYIREFLAG
jgi:pimeloyl-ACP methyl ester carboxylesterase